MFSILEFYFLFLVQEIRLPEKEVMLMSEGQEIAMGQESDPAIVAEFGLYENPALQKIYLQEKEQKLQPYPIDLI